MTTRFAALGMTMLAFAASLPAQSLESRVAAVREGPVTFRFASRPGVCGDGEHFIRTGRSSYHGSFSSGRPMEPCVFGPVQVRLTLEEGAVSRVQYWVGPLRSREARDLGQVSATEAAGYLMAVAARGSARASAKAIFPAVLADSATVWPALLAIAKDTDTRSRGTRQEATQWLARFASGAVAGRPNDLEADERARSDDEDVKTNAVFVLSQLRNGEGVPALLEVARTNKDPHVRSQALFWLGQSGDPRAIALFESVLRSPPAAIATPNLSSVRREILEWYEDNKRAFLAKDFDAIMALRTDDFHAVTPEGTRSRAEMEQGTRGFLAGIDRWISQAFEIDSLEVVGDLASAVVHQHIDRMALRGDGKVHHVETWVTQRETWRKTPTGWKLYRVDSLRDQRRLIDGQPG